MLGQRMSGKDLPEVINKSPEDIAAAINAIVVFKKCWRFSLQQNQLKPRAAKAGMGYNIGIVVAGNKKGHFMEVPL